MLSKCSCDIIRFELLFLSNVSISFSSDEISKISISGYCKFQDLLFGLLQDRSTDQSIFFVKTNISIYINSENILLSIVAYLSLCFFFIRLLIYFQLSLKCETLGMVGPGGYNVTEVFDGRYVGMFKSADNINITVNPSGVFLGKAVYLGN